MLSLSRSHLQSLYPGYEVAHFSITSSNDQLYRLVGPNETHLFAKLCKRAEVQNTEFVAEQAPDEALPIVATIPFLVGEDSWLILPLASQDGFDAAVNPATQPDDTKALEVLHQCLLVLSNFHDNTACVHGDAKLDNFVFLPGEEQPRIIDMENLTPFGETVYAHHAVLGTAGLAAPECHGSRCDCCFEEDPILDGKADVFSLAMSFLRRYEIVVKPYHRGCCCPRAMLEDLTDQLERCGRLNPDMTNGFLSMVNPWANERLSAEEAALMVGGWLADWQDVNMDVAL